MFERLTVLGVGLLGASFAMAARKQNIVRHVTGFGRSAENLRRAVDRGIIDAFETDAAAACRDADLVLFAAPVGAFSGLARSVASSLKRGAIVTDVGSVKGSLVREMSALMPEGVRYVGGHPIAGSEQSGMDHASAELFAGAKCIITPVEETDPSAIDAVNRLWKGLGAETVSMSPEEHDRTYAAVSHLPHVIAFALVSTVAEADSRFLDYCGQGFRDTTRIAGSSPEIWRDICIMNREHIGELISLFGKKLDDLRAFLASSDAARLEGEFRKASDLRRMIGQD